VRARARVCVCVYAYVRAYVYDFKYCFTTYCIAVLQERLGNSKIQKILKHCVQIE